MRAMEPRAGRTAHHPLTGDSRTLQTFNRRKDTA